MQKFKTAFFVTSIIVALCLSVLALGTVIFGYLFAIVGCAVICFFGTLMLANYFSESEGFDAGEVRKATLITILVVFFALIITCSLKIPNLQINEEIAKMGISHLSYLVGILIMFYFASRQLDNYFEKKSPQ